MRIARLHIFCHKILDYLRPNYFLILLALLFLFPSCRSKHQKFSHPEYFDVIFERAEREFRANPERFPTVIDSAFNKYPSVGIIDKYNQYRFKFRFYGYKKIINNNTGESFRKIAFSYADSMLLVLNDEKRDTAVAKCYAEALFTIGDLYFIYGDIQEGVASYLRGKGHLLSVPNAYFDTQLYNYRLGAFFYGAKNYDLSTTYYKEAYNAVIDTSDLQAFSTKHLMLVNIGYNFCLKKQFDSAFVYLSKALSEIEKKDKEIPESRQIGAFTKLKAHVNSVMGAYFLKKGEYNNVERYLLKSINNDPDTLVNPVDQMIDIANLGEAYIRLGDLKNADQAIQRVSRSLVSHPSKNVRRMLYRNISLVYVNKGDYKSGYDFKLREIGLQDSLAAIANAKNNLDIAAMVKNMEMEMVKGELEKSNDKRKIYLIVSGLLILFSFVVMLIVLNNFKKTKTLNGNLEVKNRELQESFDLLQKSYLDNIDLIKVVAHDLKNPISAIHNLSVSLLRNEKELQSRDLLELINESSKSALKVIKESLQGKNDLDKATETNNLEYMVNHCALLLGAKANEKHQTIKVASESISVSLNRQKIWRVISNLISNAIKFSYEYSVIYIGLHRRDNWAVLEVSDQGIGIDEVLNGSFPSINDLIRREGTVGEESYGIGLAVSAAIVDEHGGKLWYESKAGLGTTFYMELPIK